MTNETTTPITPATTGATTDAPAPTAPVSGNKLEKGQIHSGKVTKLLPYAALVKLANGPVTLLHGDDMSGGTFSGRKARHQSLKVGDELTVEIRSIRPPKADSRDKSNRINVSERSIQERAVREQLKAVNGDEPGSFVLGIVREVRPFGVLIEATDGPAKGYSCILHGLEVPGAERPDRDRFLKSLRVGEEIESEVLAVEEPEKAGHDLRIKLTLVAAERREMKQVLGDTNRVYRGTAGKSDKDGTLVEFGNLGSPMVGILPNHELPAATKFGDTVRVKVAGMSGGRITLTRKGIK